jgi:hypothetical protein
MIIFVCMVLGFELRVYNLSIPPALFCEFSKIGSSELFAQAGFEP